MRTSETTSCTLFRSGLESSDSEANEFEDSEEKEERGEVSVESDARETPIHATTREDINALLADGYEVDDDRLPAPENTPRNTGKTDQPVYKEGWKWYGVDHRRASGCRRDAAKLDGMNKEFISVLTYLTAFELFLPKTFVVEILLVETNKTIKGPDLDFGEFLRFIGIWLLMTSNPGTNRADYFSENPIDIFSWCSICVNQFMSGNSFESI